MLKCSSCADTLYFQDDLNNYNFFPNNCNLKSKWSSHNYKRLNAFLFKSQNKCLMQNNFLFDHKNVKYDFQKDNINICRVSGCLKATNINIKLTRAACTLQKPERSHLLLKKVEFS